MCDHDSLLAVGLIVGSIDDTKTNIVVVTKDIGSVSGTVHPPVDRALAGHETVGEVFTGTYVGVAGLVKKVPRLRSIRADVRPVVFICHILSFGLSGVIELTIEAERGEAVGSAGVVSAGEQS